MNQEKIGRFIARCRKENGYTQATLAEKLGISDRAVSKWETGKSMPDASIMLPLCELLKINANELLTGEHIIMDNYKEIAEQNLIEMRKNEEDANKKLEGATRVLAITSVISSFLLVVAGCLLAPMSEIIGAILCCLGAAIVVSGMVYCVVLEQESGYYECPNCHNRHRPSVMKVLLAIHFGSTRLLRCPECNKKAYHKKVMTK